MLFLLWGAFFVEHLKEWFSDSGHLPPWSVFSIQLFHLLLLIGYVASLKWRVAGSILVILSALLFFGSIGARAVLTFFAVSIIPAVLFLLIYYYEKKIRFSPPEETTNKN